MEVTGMLYGAKLLQFAGYPTAEVLGPDASLAVPVCGLTG